MSAQDLGARLLAEVQEEGLDELLSDLRDLVYHPKPRLGVPPLDRLLEIFCASTAAQGLGGVELGSQSSSQELQDDEDEGEDEEERVGRRQQQQHSTALPQDTTSRWKPVVVELTTQRALPAGKTNFLYYITALAVLPRGIHGGQGTAAVWLDTDGRFSATRLRQVMLGVMSNPPCTSAPEQHNQETQILEALSHIHVFRPQSSPQLLATLDSLPGHLLNTTTSDPSPARPLSLLVLDSATAFHWQDRFHASTAHLQHPSQRHDHPSRTAQVITRLKRLQREFHCAILFSTSTSTSTSTTTTTTTNDPSVPPPPSTEKHTHASSPSTTTTTTAVRGQQEQATAPQEPQAVGPWTAFAALTLRLVPVPVPGFAEQMSWEEYLRDRGMRREAVKKGVVMVEVDQSMRDMWTGRVRNELERVEGGGGFRLAVSDAVCVD